MRVAGINAKCKTSALMIAIGGTTDMVRGSRIRRSGPNSDLADASEGPLKIDASTPCQHAHQQGQHGSILLFAIYARRDDVPRCA